MRSIRQLSKCATRLLTDSAGTQGQLSACHSPTAVRAYSSAMFSGTQTHNALNSLATSSISHPHGPCWSCQLTSLVTPQLRHFNSDTSEGLQDDAEAATQLAAFDPTAVLNAVAGVEDDSWAAAREDVWFFNRYMQTALKAAQEYTGLPWWETITLATLFFRAITIPFHLQSVRNTYNMSKARPEVERLAAQLRQEQENKNPNAMSEYQRKLAGIWKRNNCHPVKSILPILVQAPVFIGFFTSLQSLAQAKVPSLMNGGTLWFSDLTVTDSTMLLPAMAFGIFLLTAELGGADGMQGQPPHVIQRFKWTMRVLTVVMVPFAMRLPASVFCYWVTSNTWSFAQSMILKQPAVKRYFGFPVSTPRPGANPTLTAVQPLTHTTAGKPIETFSEKPSATKDRPPAAKGRTRKQKR